jgi:hypothetical protein
VQEWTVRTVCNVLFENGLKCRALRDLQEGEELTICYIGNISKSRSVFLSTDLSTIYILDIYQHIPYVVNHPVLWMRKNIKLKDRKWIRIRIKFAEDQPKCIEKVSTFELFQGFEPLFGSHNPDPDP